MTEQNQNRLLPDTFDRDPELRNRLESYLQALPEDKKRKHVELIGKFMSGEMTWAEIKNIPPALLKQMARVAYTIYKNGDLQTAEVLFKALSILDHHNWYYHQALGAILQKKGRFADAIEHYDLVQQIQPLELASLVNRGICFAKLKDFDTALENFAQVAKLNLDANNPLVKKARMLSHAILTLGNQAKV